MRSVRQSTYRITGVWVQRLALEDIRHTALEAGGESPFGEGSVTEVCRRLYLFLYALAALPHYADPGGVTALSLHELPLKAPVGTNDAGAQGVIERSIRRRPEAEVEEKEMAGNIDKPAADRRARAGGDRAATSRRRSCSEIADTLLASSVLALEVTLNTSGAGGDPPVAQRYGERMLIGAGTVRTAAVRASLDAARSHRGA